MVSKVCHECGLEESALGGRNSFNNRLKSHEIKSHDCTQYGKSFPKRTTLQWHMRTVHSSPIKCCGKFFKREQQILKHQKELNFEKTCPFCQNTEGIIKNF